MLFALVVYILIAVRGTSGARWMAASVGITIVAAVIQALGATRVTLIWEFDHNGVFHLVQVIGTLVLTYGLRIGLLSKQ